MNSFAGLASAVFKSFEAPSGGMHDYTWIEDFTMNEDMLVLAPASVGWAWGVVDESFQDLGLVEADGLASTTGVAFYQLGSGAPQDNMAVFLETDTVGQAEQLKAYIDNNMIRNESGALVV